MKKVLACILAASAALPALATADDFSATDRSSRLMLYMRVSLGTNDQTYTLPRFGLSFDRSIPFASHTAPLSMRPHVSLIDLQFNAPRSQMFRLGGAAMLSGDGERSLWRNPWVWVGIGAAVIGISCATDNFPCDGDDGYGGGGSGGGGY
jgi:hypothetical protein